MNPRQSIVNSEVLLGFDDYVTSQGIDTKALYKQFGVSAQLIANKNIKLPFAIVAGLLKSAAKRSQQEDFSLKFASAQRQQQSHKAPPQIEYFDSFNNALIAAMKYYNLPGSEINWSLKAIGDKAYLTRLERLNPRVDSRHYTSLVMARCLIGLRQLCGDNWRPLEVLFSFQAPENIQTYQHYFGAPIKFDQEHTQIILPRSALYLAKDQTSSLQQDNKIDFQNDPNKWLAKVHALVRQALHNGHCQPDVIAGMLSMHSKKLQRKLQQLETNFQDIRHQIRLEEAAYYLKNSSIPITYIAEILGYSETSALSRAFKQKFKKSPLVWRKSAQ